jgi:hypothetical protein
MRTAIIIISFVLFSTIASMAQTSLVSVSPKMGYADTTFSYGTTLYWESEVATVGKLSCKVWAFPYHVMDKYYSFYTGPLVSYEGISVGVAGGFDSNNHFRFGAVAMAFKPKWEMLVAYENGCSGSWYKCQFYYYPVKFMGIGMNTQLNEPAAITAKLKLGKFSLSPMYAFIGNGTKWKLY